MNLFFVCPFPHEVIVPITDDFTRLLIAQLLSNNHLYSNKYLMFPIWKNKVESWLSFTPTYIGCLKNKTIYHIWEIVLNLEK